MTCCLTCCDRGGQTRVTEAVGRCAVSKRGPACRESTQHPGRRTQDACRVYFFSVRINETSASMPAWSIFTLYAGILPLPSEMTLFSSASVIFCTSGE